MNVHVIVCVHMIQRKACIPKCLELGSYFGAQLAPDPRPAEIETGPYKAAGEFPVGVHQVGHLLPRQNRLTFDQHQV